MLPIRTRTSLSVGYPTAEVILRTCLNFPSFRITRIQDVGPWRSSRSFLERSGSRGVVVSFDTSHGLVQYFLPCNPMSTPLRNRVIASLSISPST